MFGFNAFLLLLLFMTIMSNSNNSAVFGQSDDMPEHMASVEEGQMGKGEGADGDGKN